MSTQPLTTPEIRRFASTLGATPDWARQYAKRLMNVRTFVRGGYQGLDEPVTLIRNQQIIGFYFPVVDPDGEGLVEPG